MVIKIWCKCPVIAMKALPSVKLYLRPNVTVTSITLYIAEHANRSIVWLSGVFTGNIGPCVPFWPDKSVLVIEKKHGLVPFEKVLSDHRKIYPFMKC